MDDPERRIGPHVAATAAFAAVFLLALMALFLIDSDTPGPSGQPSPTPSPQQVGQETLLVQVTLERTRAASMLIATGGDPDRAVLLDLPQDMLLVDGPNYTPLLDTNLSLNPRLTTQATENTLGVRVDGSWRMERKALAGVVDSVGTVSVVLEAPAVFLDTLGQPVLTLPKGTSALSGPQASWYAVGIVQGEADPIAGMQRRATEVFTKVVAQLPQDDEAIAAMLTSLGSLSNPLNGTSDVSEQLLALRNDLVEGAVQPAFLPFRTSEVGDPVVTRQELDGGPEARVGAFRVADYERAEPLLRQAFASAPRVAEVDGPPRVLVWNSTPEPLSTHVALIELFDGGFIAVGAGAWSPAQALSQLNGVGYLPSGLSFTGGVAEALRLTAAEEFGDTGTMTPTPEPEPTVTQVPMMPEPDRKPLGDVDVVLGADYKPCPVDEPDCLEELK